VRARQASLLHQARGPAGCLDRTKSTGVFIICARMQAAGAACSGSEDSDSSRIALTVHDWIAVYYDSFYVFITPPESRTIRNPFLPR
jgi:hypothetical protein